VINAETTKKRGFAEDNPRKILKLISFSNGLTQLQEKRGSLRGKSPGEKPWQE
jgi:hypothetical protein